MGKACGQTAQVLPCAVGGASASGVGAALDAQAQTQLPGVVVTTPSPVAPSAPAAPAQAPAAAPPAHSPRSCRHPLVDFTGSDLRGGHRGDARPIARPALRDTRRCACAEARHRRNDVCAGFEPAGHPRLERLSRPHSGERAVDRRRVGAQRRSCHPHRSAGRRTGRGGARAGDAALRLAGDRRRRQRRQQPHSDRDPHQRHPRRDARRLQHGGRWPQRRGDRRSGRRQFRDSRRHLRALGQRLPHPATAGPAGQYQPRQRGLLARRLLSSSRTASSASPTPRSPAPISFPASRPPRARTTSCSTRANGRAGANGASTISGSRPSASGSAPPTTSTTRRDSLPVPVIGSTFLQKQYEARMEVQHLPVTTSFGVLRGAVGMQWSDRDLSAAGADGVILAPTSTQSLAGFVFEELQLTKKLRFQAAARIESDDVKGTASIFPPGFLPPPDDPDQTAAKRKFVPKSASAGILYDLPHGVVMRLTGQHVERAPDATELFYKGPHDSIGNVRDRHSQPQDRSSQHLRDRLQAGAGATSASTSRPIAPNSRTSSSSASPAPSATTTSPPAAPAPSSTRSSTRSRMRRSTASSC